MGLKKMLHMATIHDLNTVYDVEDNFTVNGNVRANGHGITNPAAMSAMTGAIASNQRCT
jgi:hypothetical protein